PDRQLADRALAGARNVIAVDLFLTESSRRADVVLPAAGFAEVDGTTTNLEGRVSTLHQRVTAPGTAQPDWVIAAELAHHLGHDLGLDSLEAVRAEVARAAPSHAGLTPELLATRAGSDGVVMPFPGDVTAAGEGSEAEQAAEPGEPGEAEAGADGGDAEA